jgi:two-component system, LuxR family, response regulator FixJ
MSKIETRSDSSSIRVYVVDDETDLRASLAFALEAASYQPETFASAEAFLAAVDPTSAEGCAIIDFRLPGMNGIELAEMMVRRGTRLRMIIVTAFGQLATAVRAFQTGVLDFIEKPFAPGEIVEAVRRAMCAPPASYVLSAEGAAAATQLAKLTSREREVFDLLAAGWLGKEVGRKLDLSPRTIEVHRANIMRRLGIRTVPDMVRLALLVEFGGEHHLT